MKTLMLAVAASLAFAGVAAAQDSETITLNGTNPPKCGISAAQPSVSIGEVSDTNGFLVSGLSSTIAGALDTAGITAWCTGAQNGVVLGRTSLTTGDGSQLNGFNQSIGYDIALNIAGATRVGGVTPQEGSSDGSDGSQTGPGAPNVGNSMSSFGATPGGAAVTFVSEANAFATSTVATGMPARSVLEAGQNGNRLAAGNYTGTVQINVIPGV